MLGSYKERMIRYEEGGRIFELILTPKPNRRLFFNARITNLGGNVMTAGGWYLNRDVATQLRDQLTTWLEAQPGEEGKP